LVAGTAGALAASLLRGRLRAVAGGVDDADGADGAAPALAAGRWCFADGARRWSSTRSSSRARFDVFLPFRTPRNFPFFVFPVRAINRMIAPIIMVKSDRRAVVNISRAHARAGLIND